MKGIFLAISLFVLVAVSCNEQKKEGTVMKEQKNEVVETIMSRRSIRSYKPEQIKPEQLDTILRCAVNAPSALNKQTWQVRVVQNPDILKAINDGFVKYAADKEMQGSASRSQQPEFSIYHGAPTLMIVAGKKSESYSTVDCALLGQNVVLAAESMDIGSCIIGSVAAYLKTPEAMDTIVAPYLNITDDYELLFAISLGYKNEHPDAKPRDESKIHIIR